MEKCATSVLAGTALVLACAFACAFGLAISTHDNAFADEAVEPTIVEPALSYDFVDGVYAGEYAYMAKKVKTGEGEYDYAWVRDVVHVTDGTVVLHTADKVLSGMDIPGGDTDFVWNYARWGEDYDDSYIPLTSLSTGEASMMRLDGTELFPMGAYDAYAFCWRYSSYDEVDLIAAQVDGSTMLLDIIKDGVVIGTVEVPFDGKLPVRAETGVYESQYDESSDIMLGRNLKDGYVSIALEGWEDHLYLHETNAGFELVDTDSLEWTAWKDVSGQYQEAPTYSYTLADGTEISSLPGIIGGSQCLISDSWDYSEGNGPQGRPVVRGGYYLALYYGEDVEDFALGKFNNLQHGTKDMFWATDELEYDKYRVTKTGKFGVIDSYGKVIVPVVYEGYCDSGLDNTDWALVKQDGKWKFINIAEALHPEPGPIPDNAFVDVVEGDWFYEAVYYCFHLGLMGGYKDASGELTGYFGPYDTMDRAMVVTTLWRMAGEPAAAKPLDFDDCDEGAYYAPAVAWAAENGITTGYAGTKDFGPYDKVTREQYATFLHRTAKYMDVTAGAIADLSGYNDYGEISDYAREALSWANSLGIITGYKDAAGNPTGYIGPQGNALRSEAAAILMRFDKVKDLP